MACTGSGYSPAAVSPKESNEPSRSIKRTTFSKILATNSLSGNILFHKTSEINNPATRSLKTINEVAPVAT
jgi:hypothetical protein